MKFDDDDEDILMEQAPEEDNAYTYDEEVF